MDLRQFFSIILARGWIVGLVTLTVLASALGFGFLRAPTYTASTQVLLDLVSADPVAGASLPPAMSQAYLATQTEILNSQKVALKVVDRLSLHEKPETLEAWQGATDGRGSIRQWCADELLRRLDVRPARDSSVLSITYTGSTASGAAEIANAFAQAYIAAQVEIRAEPAKQSRTWFSAQVQTLRDQLDFAQRRVTDYQRAKGIFSSEERFDIENSRLQDLSTQLVVVASLTAESAKRKQLAQESLHSGSASELPEILQNPLVQQLKANQARLEARIKELSAIYGGNHPEILKVVQDLESTRTRVLQEMGTVASSLTKSHAVAERREGELRLALEAQRGRVMAIKQSRDELKVLERDLDNAQRAYDQALQRLNQNGQVSQSTQANIVTLNPAVEPLKPTTPNHLLNGLVGVFLGLLLGGLAAFILELSDRRIRNQDDLSRSLDGPVIGQIRLLSDKTLRLARSTASP